jgi:hypothetical protein
VLLFLGIHKIPSGELERRSGGERTAGEGPISQHISNWHDISIHEIKSHHRWSLPSPSFCSSKGSDAGTAGRREG